MLSIDVKRAYFYAAAREDIYIEIPMEDLQPGDADKVARLNLSFYGTRGAAKDWTEEYTKVAGAGICGWFGGRWGGPVTSLHGSRVRGCE